MNVWKKISALTFVLIVAFALSVSAFASTAVNLGTDSLPDNVTAGVASGTNNNDGTFASLNKTINLKKDIIVHNPNSTGYTVSDAKVAQPEFSYTYTVEPVASADAKTVTDGTVSVTTKPGILVGLTVNNGTAGTANNTPVTGTLPFATTNFFAASSTGATNTYDIALNFSNVHFLTGDGALGSGVYRYKITESLTSGADYDTFSMTDGGMNIVYLDVYVDGTDSIYGYVCLPANSNVNTSTANKTNGFVYSATSGENGADSYFTYDLTLSKTVQNDNYAMANHAFPFTVIFTPDTKMTTKFKITETITQASGDTNQTTGITTAASNNGWSGVANIKSGASILYSGIPCGVDVEVYETNDMNGVTYSVTTSKNSGTGTTEPVISTATTPTSASAQSNTKNDYESTKTEFDTTLATAVAAAQTCAINNALINISPTGVTLRYAPYLLTLGAGVTALPLTRRYKKREEDLV